MWGPRDLHPPQQGLTAPLGLAVPHRRVAEHDKDVQQLCEALEQQIEQEQQRLQQEVGHQPLFSPYHPPREDTGAPNPYGNSRMGERVLMSLSPCQSVARSHQHSVELQRALDASEREVQRLVTAQMEVRWSPIVRMGSLGCACSSNTVLYS